MAARITDKPMARTAGIVMFLILISRILGLIREQVVAFIFGQNWQTDVFTAAFTLPDLMYILLIAGGLNAAFIPVFTAYLARGKEREGWQMAWTFFALGLIFLVIFTVAGAIFTPALTPLVAYAYQGRERALLIQLMRIMFPAVFFTALAGLGMGIHKSYKSFSAPLWGPIFYNVGIIIGTYMLAPRLGITGMALATVTGAFLNFIIQLPFFIKKCRSHPFALNLHHPGLHKVLYLMGPAVVSSSIVQVNLIINRNLASALPEGSIRALQNANTLVQFPLGVFAMGVGMVILPTLSGLMAQGETERFRATFSEGLRMVLFVTIPSAIGLAVLREPLIRLLFQSGQFTADDTQQAAYALLFYTIGLVSQAAIQILIQVFYSLQDTRTLVRVSATAIVLNTALSLTFLYGTNMQHGGLALAYSLTSLVNLATYLHQLRKRIGSIDGRRLLRTSLLSLTASACMAVSAGLSSRWAARYAGSVGLAARGAEVAVGVGVGILVYFTVAWLLKMDEITLLLQALRGKRHSTSGSAT